MYRRLPQPRCVAALMWPLVTYRAESGGNGARLANIMISNQAEGARFALIREDAPLRKGHPETRQAT